MLKPIDTQEILEAEKPDLPRHELVFFGFLLAAAYLVRESQGFEYPRLLWLVAAMAAGHLALNRLQGRIPGIAILVSIGLNLLLISYLVDSSGRTESVLWPLYLLPTFTAAFTIPGWTRRVGLLGAVLLGLLSVDRLVEDPGVAGGLCFKGGFLAASAWIISVLAIREKRSRRTLQSRELQMQQAVKLEALGRLAGGVAHDFNNQLMVISGYSEFLLRGLPQNSRLRDDVDEIKKATVRTAALTRQLLAFGRRQTLKPQIFKLNGLLAGQQRLLERVIGEDISVRLAADPEDASIMADPGSVEQAVMNLAVNSRDAMQNGGSLELKAESRDVEADLLPALEGVVPGPYVVLSVSDTGAGMDRKTQARIFEPFFTTKAPGKGTGLGLAMVYGTVRQSGGFVQVDSELGKGTTIRLFFPRAGEASVEAEPSAAAAAAQGAETILVVEDNAGVRQIARRVLRQNGYQVLEAADGKDGLEIVRRHAGPIHLLLTDIVMHEMSGRELASHTERLRPGTPVLYMTGYADDDSLDWAQHGAAILHKPIAPAQLAARVREMLDAARK